MYFGSGFVSEHKMEIQSQKSQEIKKKIVTFREAILLLTLLKGKILYKLFYLKSVLDTGMVWLV